MGGGASKTETGKKKLCKNVIAGSTTMQDKTDKMKSAFKVWDSDNSNTISKEELVKVLEQLGTKLSAKDQDLLFKEADANHDASVSYEEFVDWLTTAPNLKRYFEVSEQIMKRNMEDAKKLTDQMNKELMKGNMDIMRTVGPKMEALQKKSQARIDKELTPIIKKAFAYHDKDGSGALDKDESLIFFSNYADMLPPFLESTCELATTQQMDMMQMQSPGKLMEAFRAEMAKLKTSHLVNVDKHHQAAFAALDTNNDGKLQEKEVVEALLHGHRKNEEFMHALGLVVPPEALMGAAAAEAMGAVGQADCAQQ
jgi:Ca2+-binding EF-hand superfamily protein